MAEPSGDEGYVLPGRIGRVPETRLRAAAQEGYLRHRPSLLGRVRRRLLGRLSLLKRGLRKRLRPGPPSPPPGAVG